MAHDLKHITSSGKHDGVSVMLQACMAANGTESHVFINDVTADRSSRSNSDVYGAILFFKIQADPAEVMGQCFTVQLGNDPKHTGKATQELVKAKKCSILQQHNQSSDLN